MIRMPQRNVTRFIIPLIDVLILLFCIFLLMEFNSASQADEESEKGAEASAESEVLASTLERRTKELQRFEEIRPQLDELNKLLDELERLRNANQKNLQQKAYVRLIDIDPKDGTISFFDDTKPNQPARKITDAKSARKLIDEHKQEANGREVYYYFVYPRTRSIYPLFGQEQNYKEWFRGAANSLVKG
jgi:TolA-binding protein